jgi:uncharacterized protein (TIGR02996 family)
MRQDHSAAGLRQALEAALVANPEDLSAHRAYADWLAEQGDPRGEFIQMQLALEQASGSDRNRLAQQERALLRQHQEAWLGELARAFLGRDDITFRFCRGWLDEVRVGTLREDLAELLAQAPEIRLLRRFLVVNPEAQKLDRSEAYRTHVLAGVAWFDPDEEAALQPLLDSPYLGNVRVFQLGDPEHERCDVGDGPIAGLIEKMPQLEELRLFLWRLEEAERIFSLPLPHLRILHVGGEFDYPLSALSQNASLGALEELLLQPAAPDGHSKIFPDACIELLQSPHLTALRRLYLCFLLAGDLVCEALAESSLLARLRVLELEYSQITDAGAALLAGNRDLGQLERLDLVGNHLTEESIAQLRGTGVYLAWEPQVPEDTEDGEEEEEETPPGQIRCQFCHEFIAEVEYEQHVAQHVERGEDGQQTDYATLPPEERFEGSLDVVPRVYRHEVCGTATAMPEEIIRSYLIDPHLYLADQTFCAGCGEHVPFSECVWVETEQDLQSYMDALRAEKPS